MLFDHIPHCLHLHNELILHEQVGIEVAEQRPILVEHFQRMLLFHLQALFPKTVSQSILINLLQVSVPMLAVDSKSRFANHIAKLHDVFHKTASFLSICAVCAFSWPSVYFVNPSVFLRL